MEKLMEIVYLRQEQAKDLRTYALLELAGSALELLTTATKDDTRAYQEILNTLVDEVKESIRYAELSGDFDDFDS